MADPAADIASHFARASIPRVAVAGASVQVPVRVTAATRALALTCVFVGVAAALTRGPWIDEFWTLFAIDHALPIGAAFRQRWLTDVHPPLFPLLSRLMSDVLGSEIPILRLQNGFAVAGLAAFFLYARRRWDHAERFLVLGAILAFSSYFTVGYLAEYRSYCAQFAFGVCFHFCAYALLRTDILAGQREWRTAVAILTVTALLLVNLHFVTALLTGMSLFGFAVIALMLRQPRRAALFCGIGVVAAAPLVAILVLQAPYLLGRTGGQFWITTGLFGALAILAGSIAKGIGLNLAACGIAFWAVAGNVASRARGRAATSDLMIGTMFLAIPIAQCMLLLVVNRYTPIIVDRYLVLCSAAILCGVSILARDLTFSWRWGFTAVLANAVLFLVIEGHKLVGEPRWNATAALIRATVAACPTSRVIAFPFPYAGVLPNENAVFALGYRYLAERYDFRVTMAAPGAPIARDDAGGCPTLLWTEHVLWDQPMPKGPNFLVLDTARQVLGPIDLATAKVERTKTGAVIVLPPNRSR